VGTVAVAVLDVDAKHLLKCPRSVISNQSRHSRSALCGSSARRRCWRCRRRGDSHHDAAAARMSAAFSYRIVLVSPKGAVASDQWLYATKRGERPRSLGRTRLTAASRARSAGSSLGREVCRRSTRAGGGAPRSPGPWRPPCGPAARAAGSSGTAPARQVVAAPGDLRGG
jgi:hypothetical protein